MLKNISYVLYVVSVIFLVFGFITMYNYGDYNSETNIFGNKAGHIVGGDAYNYIIIGIRGVGIILCGLLFSIVASTLIIIESIRNKEIKHIEPSSNHEVSLTQ